METLQSTKVVIFQFPDESVKVPNFTTSQHLRRIQWNGLAFQGVNVLREKNDLVLCTVYASLMYGHFYRLSCTLNA